MPKLTLLLERKPLQVYDLSDPVIRVGRAPGLEIVIDNVSVSRRQTEIRQDGAGWVVRDLGSANGTFLNGTRLAADAPLKAGDEITFGKFSLFFERTVEGPLAAATAVVKGDAERADATFQMGTEEMERLQRATAQRRQAQLRWQVAGAEQTHFIGRDTGAVLVGRARLCDVRVPGGARYQLLVLRAEGRFVVRNLSAWRGMRVNGKRARQATLKSGDVVALGKLRLAFLDEVG
jgi:pSer/pThr/pTyr-binding forkhead associated (FHA) protein